MRGRLAAGLSLAAAVYGGVAADTLLVANKSDATIDLIDLETNRSRATVPTGEGPHEVAVSADGAVAVVSNYGNRGEWGASLTVVNVAKGQVMRTIELGRHRAPHGLQWVSDAQVAVTAEGSRHLLLIDVREGAVVAAIDTAQDIPHMVAVTPGSERAFVSNIRSGSVTAIDLEDRVKLADIKTGAGAEGVAVTPDGAEVWVTNRAAGTLAVIDAADLKVVATLISRGFPMRIAITPDGTRALVSCARTGEVALYDIARRKELQRAKLDLHSAPEAARQRFGDRFGDSPVPVGLAIAPDGKSAWVAATQSDAVVVVDTETLEVLDLIRAGRQPDGMAYSPL